MASNLSCLGFDVSDGESLEELVLTLAENATLQLECEAGDYRIWRSRTGAELWLHLADAGDGSTQEREIVGLTPFFEGESAVQATLAASFQREGDNAFEGSFQGWIAIDPDDTPDDQPPRGEHAGRSNGHSKDSQQLNDSDNDADLENLEDLDDGSYPLIFDCVDYAAHQNANLPSTARLRLTGFVRELTAFADAAAFEAAQPASDFPMASQSFFPVGMFAAAESADSEDDAPSAHAMFTGRVVKTERFINEETGQPFHWALIDSLNATFDVVADPESITGDLKPGATVQVACWFFGRILDPVA